MPDYFKGSGCSGWHLRPLLLSLEKRSRKNLLYVRRVCNAGLRDEADGMANSRLGRGSAD
jgi:hypothetical protein